MFASKKLPNMLFVSGSHEQSDTNAKRACWDAMNMAGLDPKELCEGIYNEEVEISKDGRSHLIIKRGNDSRILVVRYYDPITQLAGITGDEKMRAAENKWHRDQKEMEEIIIQFLTS